MAERIPDVSSRVPVPANVTTTEKEGRITVQRRRFGPFRTAILRVFGIPPVFTVHLDPLGSAAWGLMDGKRTVGQIHAELARAFPQEEQLPQRLGRYVGELVSRRMIRLD